MFLNIVLVLLTLLGTVVYLLTVGSFWMVGAGLVFFIWLVYLLFNFPYKPSQTRGWWTLVACFFLIAVVAAAVLLFYWQNNEIRVTLTNDSLNLLPHLGARLLALLLGAVISLVLTLVFFVVVGYFSVVYILALPQEENLGFWTAFRSYVSLMFNIQYTWLLVENGKITEIREKGFAKTWLSLGRVIIQPGNVVVFQKGGKITRICGPGIVATERNEFIRGAPFDLRPQFHLETLKNVITADRIPLEIEVGIGYQLKPATHLDDPSVITARIKEDEEVKLFPISRETLRRAAFNVTDWHLLAQGACKNILRDQIMAHTIDELFTIQTGAASVRVNQRQIKIIEQAVQEAVNSFAIDNVGVEITGVDVRQITLPDDVKEAVYMAIKARAEAISIRQIEAERNTARGELISRILDSISIRTNREIGEIELQLATVFAHITRRALTDDVLGHQYVEMLKALAEGKGTNIFNAMSGSQPIEPGGVLSELYLRQHEPAGNGHK